MGKFTVGPDSIGVGSVVLVTFPFSNLPARIATQSVAGGKGQKIRPALVLANAEFDNLILCQITSKPYTSKIAICIKSKDFTSGNLPVVSYVRPDKLFTADTTIIKNTVGRLTPKIKNMILRRVRELFIPSRVSTIF